jgi:hypothetical protein
MSENMKKLLNGIRLLVVLFLSYLTLAALGVLGALATYHDVRDFESWPDGTNIYLRLPEGRQLIMESDETMIIDVHVDLTVACTLSVSGESVYTIHPDDAKFELYNRKIVDQVADGSDVYRLSLSDIVTSDDCVGTVILEKKGGGEIRVSGAEADYYAYATDVWMRLLISQFGWAKIVFFLVLLICWFMLKMIVWKTFGIYINE